MSYRLYEKALYKLGEPKKDRKRYGVLDLETNGLGGGFIAGACGVEENEEIIFYEDLELLVKELFAKKNRDVIWYGHNLSEYDLKYLIQYIQENHKEIKIECSVRGSRITWSKLKKSKHVVELRDSMQLMQMKLSKIAEMMQTNELKGDIDFDKETFDLQNPVHRDYLRRDIVVLLDALTKLDTILFEHFGIHLKPTMSSTALACFRTTLENNEIHWRIHEEADAFCREGYFGGMVFLRERRFIDNVTHVDVNAMYASVMRESGVPTGAAIYTEKEMDGYDGFYRCNVKADNIQFTFIPYRNGDILSYPLGEFTTVIDSDSIRFARSIGYEIEIIEGYVFEKVDHIFDTFINFCEQMELPNKMNAIGAAIKLVRNSCYGIFGLKPIGKKVIVSEEDNENATPIFDDKTGELLYGFWEEENEIKAGYIQPHWAAWITAHARLKLTKMVYGLGVDNVFYGDTDSLVIKTEVLLLGEKSGIMSIGKKYGEVKVEATYQRFISFGPKNYLGIISDTETSGKAKGIPKRLYTKEKQLESIETLHKVKGKWKTSSKVEYQSMISTVKMIQSNQPFVHMAERSYSILENSQAWILTDDEKVLPITIGG
jgi:DNA polymerase elongation subunit (family B)